MARAEPPQFAFRLQGKFVQYLDSAGNLLWDCDIDRVVLVAEFISDEVPHGERHFLVFWSFEDQELHRALATTRAEGVTEMLRELSQYWNDDLRLELSPDDQKPKDWQSRVLWPPELAGHLYLTEEELPPTTWKQKVRRRMAGPIMQWFPTEEVSEYLRRFKPDF